MPHSYALPKEILDCKIKEASKIFPVHLLSFDYNEGYYIEMPFASKYSDARAIQDLWNNDQDYYSSAFAQYPEKTKFGGYIVPLLMRYYAD